MAFHFPLDYLEYSDNKPFPDSTKFFYLLDRRHNGGVPTLFTIFSLKPIRIVLFADKI